MPRNEQPIIQPINNREYRHAFDFNFYFKVTYSVLTGLESCHGYIDKKGELTLTVPPQFTVDGTVRVHVPAEEETDGASVPWVLWSTGFSPMGDHIAGSSMHDYLYKYRVTRGLQVRCVDALGNVTWEELQIHGESEHRRLFADKMFLMGMVEFQSSWAKRTAFYNAVRTFGGRAY